jgi:hypothetical protein
MQMRDCARGTNDRFIQERRLRRPAGRRTHAEPSQSAPRHRETFARNPVVARGLAAHLRETIDRFTARDAGPYREGARPQYEKNTSKPK